jgi:hypothetical protein
VLSALLSVALVAPAEARPRHSVPDRIDLPAGFLPEGITIGKAPVAYLGSRADGDIYAVSLRTGKLRRVSEGPGPGNPSVGLKIDKRGLLYVAGGNAGTGRVVSARTGRLLASYTFTTARPTFVNDVVLTDRYAWFTDSQQPQLYRVERTRTGRGAASADVDTLPLTGAWQQIAGVNNANGIARTPDGRALLVVNSSTGVLFRVNTRTGAATPVDLGGASLTTVTAAAPGPHPLRGPEPAQRGRGGQAQPARHRGPAGRHADQPGLRRADHGRRVQGQPLPAQCPVRDDRAAGDTGEPPTTGSPGSTSNRPFARELVTDCELCPAEPAGCDQFRLEAQVRQRSARTSRPASTAYERRRYDASR